MKAIFSRLGLSELLPRYIFSESFYARKRVLELGAVASTEGKSSQFLLDRGARSVVACDPDSAAVEKASRQRVSPQLRFRAPHFDDLDEGSFDFIAVADLEDFVRAPEMIGELKRLLSKTGVLMGGLRNPAGLALSQLSSVEECVAVTTLGQLTDALSVHFSFLEAATQNPVLGYQLGFESSKEEVIDGSLISFVEAAYFVILAGNAPLSLPDSAWVQLAPEPLAYLAEKIEHHALTASEERNRSRRLAETLSLLRSDFERIQAQALEDDHELSALRESMARNRAELQLTVQHPTAGRENDQLTARLRKAIDEAASAQQSFLEAQLQVSRLIAEKTKLSEDLENEKSKGAKTLELARVARAQINGLERRLHQLEVSEEIWKSAQVEVEGLRESELQSRQHQLDLETHLDLLQADRIDLTSKIGLTEASQRALEEKLIGETTLRTRAQDCVRVLEAQLQGDRHVEQSLKELRDEHQRYRDVFMGLIGEVKNRSTPQ